jgi:hypothetical protein
MSTVQCNFIKSLDGLVNIDVKTIATGGAGVITFPSNAKTFLRGDNTFTTTLSLTGSEAPHTTQVANSMDVQRYISSGDSATNRGWTYRVSAGFGFSFFTGDDAGLSVNPIWTAKRTGTTPTVLAVMPFSGRVTIGNNGGAYPTDDGVNALQVTGTMSATSGLNMPATGRQIVAPNITYDLYGAVVAASYYVNGTYNVAGAGQQNELISLRPSSVTLSGVGATASMLTFANQVVSSIAGTTGYGIIGSVINSGAGKSTAIYGRAVGSGAHSGILIGGNFSVNTVAGTDTIATSCIYASWTGVTSCHFGLQLTGEAVGDAVDYAIYVNQSAKVIGSHILLQRGAAPCNTSANFMQCDDVTASATFFKITSIGSIVFGGTAQRIQGDFSNGTIGNRLAFQTTTLNGSTIVPFITNGTGVASGFQLHDSSDAANAGRIAYAATTTGHSINVTSIGTGVLRSLQIQMNTVPGIILQSTGRVLLGNNPTDDAVNGVQVSNADLSINTLGRGLRIKQGANAKQGRAVLVAGTVTVANTSVGANSDILITSQIDGGAPGFLRISARVNGTSFTITSSSGTDTSTVGWMMLEPAP